MLQPKVLEILSMSKVTVGKFPRILAQRSTYARGPKEERVAQSLFCLFVRAFRVTLKARRQRPTFEIPRWPPEEVYSSCRARIRLLQRVLLGSQLYLPDVHDSFMTCDEWWKRTRKAEFIDITG